MRAVMEGRIKMRTIKAKRLTILEKVKTNREKHIAEYNEAMVGYKEVFLKKLNESIEKLNTKKAEITDKTDPGDFPLIAGNLLKPESHEKDYDQVIAMFTDEVREEIEVNSDEYACYVMDDWDWKEQFSVTNSRYKA